MAQNVTPRADPPGWRAKRELVDWLEELAQRIGPFRESVRGINDATFAQRAALVLETAAALLSVHLPEPRDGVVADLEGLERATDNWRLPRFDLELGEPTETLERLRSATGLLLRAIQDARRAADEARGADAMPRQPIAIDPGKVQGMLRRLDAVENELKRVARERDTAQRFVQQNGLVNLYVGKMRVKLDLARLHLTIGDAILDIGALSSAVEAMGAMTVRFRAAVKAWVNRVTGALSESAKTIGAAVLRVVRGAQTLEKAAIRASDPTRRRFSFEPEMVLIQPGSFTMGIPEAESTHEKTEEWDAHARPQHSVTIRRPFLLGKYPVTRGEYAEFARETNREWRPPDFKQTDRHPAVNVSFDDAVAYADWLYERTGRRYRLPSEAEWEYACRAGTKTARYWGERPDRKLANFEGKATTEVDAYKPNRWGLYDMLGNVFEWIEDVWHESYDGAPANGLAWTDGGDPGRRVLRGGSWNGDHGVSRAGFRDWDGSGDRGSIAGFRLARTL
jgi:formylglycine-generating enzyme required for sulfatase activity